MSIIKTFKDSLNNIVYPATHAKAVFVEKGNTHTDLQNYLETEQGGHTILDNSGTSMTQQPNLQFSGLNVTNDGTNSKTVVKSPIFNGTTAQWTALSSAEKAKYSVVNISDDYGDDSVRLGRWDAVPSDFVWSSSNHFPNKAISCDIDISQYKSISIFLFEQSASNSYYFNIGCHNIVKLEEWYDMYDLFYENGARRLYSTIATPPEDIYDNETNMNQIGWIYGRAYVNCNSKKITSIHFMCRNLTQSISSAMYTKFTIVVYGNN